MPDTGPEGGATAPQGRAPRPCSGAAPSSARQPPCLQPTRSPRATTGWTARRGPAVALNVGGAGGNRTPVRRAVAASATTIPDCRVADCVPSGRLPLGAPPDLSPVSAVFLAVSGLSRLSSPASVARLQRTGPACPRGGRSYLTVRSVDQAARSTGSSLPCLVVPRFWSLSNSGRVARFPVSTSIPISPLSMCGTPHCTEPLRQPFL